MTSPKAPPVGRRPVTNVAYIGNFRHPWCTEVHVAGSLEALGHRVHRLQENELRWQDLPRIVARGRAQLVLWTRTWDVPADRVTAALDACRADGVPSAFYHLDRWWGLEREYQVETMPWFQATDVTFSPDGDPSRPWAEAGVRHVWLPPGVYAAECGQVAPNPQRWPAEVVFVGSYPYPHPDWADYRRELIETLEGHFGPRFARWPQGRAVRGADLQELYATAKVVVGDSCLAGGATHYWSDRVPETLGRGGLLIHPDLVGLGSWYDSTGMPVDGRHAGADLLTYELGRFDQLVVLADWALANPEAAREVAEHGRATVLGRDTYAHRMATVLQWCTDHLGVQPTTPAPDRQRAHQQAATARQRAAGAPAGPEGTQVLHVARAGATAALYVRAGHPTDLEVVGEVWAADQYQVRAEHVSRGTVVDIGANIGAFTVLAARMGAARVHAYEPEPGNYALLEANVAANPPVARGARAPAGVVVLHPVAVGADPGELVLAPGPDGVHGGGTHMAALRARQDDDVAVPVVAIDVVLQRALAENGSVALLKLDCEGAEYGIIAGADPELLAQVRRITMEWHGPGMPHLAHLADLAEWHPDDDDDQAVVWAHDVWGRMVGKLAGLGRVSTFGRPWMGGLLQWEAY